MKKIHLFSLIFLLSISSNLLALNLAPVAVNDTITVNSAGTYIFNPTLNDYDADGDPFTIIIASFKHQSGMVTHTDSTITINMIYTSGIDTIGYFLRDNQNNISNEGFIIVHINNNYTSDTLTINNVRAAFVPYGNAFWDFVSNSHFEVPAGSGKTTIFTSVPWIGGIDNNNNLHLAAETYRGNGADYFYGPVCDTAMLNQYSDTLWNRVWKISEAEIDYHKNNYWKSSYTVPEAIANWPAFGDTLLGQNYNMAPFIDKNNDGKYVPSDGDYPKIRGDQSVFLIYNDNKKSHTESGGLPLGVEIHQWAYAYNCSSDTALDHTIFIHYDIYNRSANNYHDIYLGLFTDFDIGYSYDDFIGCDSTQNLFYSYNGNPIDGLGKPNHYGANPPAQGVIFLNENMSSFMASYNIGMGGPALDPSNDTGFYYFMQAKWGDGSHLTYGGYGYQGATPTNYIYSGDPNDTTTWSERAPSPNPGNAPYDRRGVGSIGPFNLATGAVKSIDIAYVYARDITKSNIENVTVLKNAVDKIQLYYDNDSTPCGGSFTSVAKPETPSNALRIYPVPTQEIITLDYLPNSTSCSYEIYSLTGKLVQSGVLNKNKLHSFIVSNYAKGIYFILIRDQQQTFSRKFIVQ